MPQQPRVLVTGAGGFIGHHLVSFLKQRGYWVRGVDIKRPEYAPSAADEFAVLESVALNGFVDDHDPATGQRAEIFVATVMATRTSFAPLNLQQVSAVDCLADGLRGQVVLAQREVKRRGLLPGWPSPTASA